ncbi:MAG TPA: PHP domain-containing protein [Anaerolineales bacterium]|nr:PHP domain-containing protein [Anaerolineales bacterium]
MRLSTTNLLLASDAGIDLQLHTTYSDGVWTPEQLIDHLVEEKFSLAAITDHDRLDTVAALQQLAVEKHVPLLVAAEMSASWQGGITDLLCFGFEVGPSALRELSQTVLQKQQENTREVYENLLRKGYTFQGHPEALSAILEKPGSQQPKELVALLKTTGEESAGKIVWEAGCTFMTNDLPEIVEAAHQSGAVCLLAHPGRKDGFITYDVELLDKLRQEIPIDGLEVYYPAHTPEQTTMFLEYARRHNLLISAGSDSHSPEKPPIKYPAELSRSLLERLGIQILQSSQ